MELVGRNLVPTPRFDAQARGLWHSQPVTSVGIAEREGAGLDGSTANRIAPSGNQGPFLAVPIDGEAWQNNHSYRVFLRIYRSQTQPVIVALGPEGGRDFSAYGNGIGYGTHTNAHTIDPGAAGYQTIEITLTLDPAAEFEDELGSPIYHIGQQLYFYAFVTTSDQFAQVALSHIRVDHDGNMYGDGYFDGEGQSPSDPDQEYPDVTFEWSGTAWASPTNALIAPAPDPTPITRTVTLPAGASGGTFTLTYDTHTTGPIAWNAEPFDVLAELATIGPGFDVTGTPGVTYDVTVPDELATWATDLTGITTDPDPDPDPDEKDPWDVYAELATVLAAKVAAFIGRPGDATATAVAEAQLPVVISYVNGYTRGRGFETGAPSGRLKAVIVSATARLATNPEQVSYYSIGDYSERPAVLAGWTLAELAILRRYRRVSA